MSANPNIDPAVIQYVRLSSALAKRAMDKAAAAEAVVQKAAGQAPQVLDLMVATGAILASEKQAAAAMLADPAQAMTLLKAAVEKLGAAKQKLAAAGGHMGGPDKQASDGANASFDSNWSLNSNYLGQRTSMKKASDVAFEQALGL